MFMCVKFEAKIPYNKMPKEKKLAKSDLLLVYGKALTFFAMLCFKAKKILLRQYSGIIIKLQTRDLSKKQKGLNQAFVKVSAIGVLDAWMAGNKAAMKPISNAPNSSKYSCSRKCQPEKE